jgi:hypothetical protein
MLPLDCWFFIMLIAGFALGFLINYQYTLWLEDRCNHQRKVIADLTAEVGYLQGKLDKARTNP